MLANSLIELDRAHLIHPVASYRGHERQGVRVLKSASGATVTEANGHQLVDGFAGLWCVNAGYGHESIIEAATEAIARASLRDGLFRSGLGTGHSARRRTGRTRAGRSQSRLLHARRFGCGGLHHPLRPLLLECQGRAAARSVHLDPAGLSRLDHGWAGLTALPAFHAGFGLPFDWQHKIPSPYPYRNPEGSDDAAIIAASLASLKAKIEDIGADRVAAFYAEPIQGSGGVIVPPRGWIKAMRELCKSYGILFIADEVITGFGRTGPLFACTDEGIVPDMMTVAKGLTSGYVPMGAVFMADHVYDVIADGAGEAAVGHGFTYSAHPVSAAVALEVLKLYEGGLLENGIKAGQRLLAGLQSLSDHPLVGEIRGRGMLYGVELVTDKAKKTPLPAAAQPARRIFDRAWDHGLVIRAFPQGVLGYAPPLCCTDADIDAIVDRTRKTLDETLQDPDIRKAMA